MAKTTGTYPPIGLETPIYMSHGRAVIIALLSIHGRTGKTSFLRELIHSSYFQEQLQKHKKRGLIIDLSSDPNSGETLLGLSKEENTLLAVKLDARLQAPGYLDARYKIEPDDLVKTLGTGENIDVITVAPRFEDGHKIIPTILKYLPRLVHGARDSYDFIFIDLPPLCFYVPETTTLAAMANYLLVPYFFGNPMAMRDLFDINCLYMAWRVAGLRMRFGGIIPIFANVSLNCYSHNIESFTTLFGSENIWPLIPDRHEDIAAVQNSVGDLADIGIAPTVDKFIKMIKKKNRPSGLSDQSEKLGRIFLDIYNPLRKYPEDFRGLKKVKEKGSWEANEHFTIGEYAKKLGIEKVVKKKKDESEAKWRKRVAKFTADLIKSVSITRHRTLWYCERKMKIELRTTSPSAGT